MRLLIAKIKCFFLGHDYGPAVAISPAFLTCCTRCGRDIQDRSIDDLEPITEADHDLLESIELAEEDYT